MALRAVVRSIVILAVCLLFPALGRADGKLRPAWVKPSPAALMPNQSFLADLERDFASEPLLDLLVDGNTADAWRRQYENMASRYETEKNFGLIDRADQAAFSKQLRDFYNDAFAEVKKRQRNKGLERARRAALRDENLTKPVPAAMIGALVIASSGEPVEVPFFERTFRLTARSQLFEKKGGVSLSSPVLDGSFEFLGTAPERSTDPNMRDERYRISLLREIPFLDVTSGLTYGSTTNMVTTSVSKRLNAYWTAVLDSTHKMLAAEPGARTAEETFRLLYDLRF